MFKTFVKYEKNNFKTVCGFYHSDYTNNLIKSKYCECLKNQVIAKKLQKYCKFCHLVYRKLNAKVDSASQT